MAKIYMYCSQYFYFDAYEGLMTLGKEKFKLIIIVIIKNTFAIVCITMRVFVILRKMKFIIIT